MQFSPDSIGFAFGLLFCAIVVAQATMYFYGTTRQWALNRRVSRMRIAVLNEELETATRRRQTTPTQTNSWNGFRRFVVKSAIRETASSRSIYLVPLDRRPLPGYFPGQFLTLRFDIPGQSAPLVRCYSLSDRPRQEYYRCSVKSIKSFADGSADQGIVSRHVNVSLQEGDVVEALAPSGEFMMDLFERRPAILLAGGIGITPLLSMLHSVAHEQSGRQVILIYGVRNGNDHAFRDELEALDRANDNIRVVTCYSKPNNDDRRGRDFDIDGRMSVELLRELLPSNNFEFFLCGPQPMMQELESGLGEWGVPKHRIRSEAFAPPTDPETRTIRAPSINISNALGTIRILPEGAEIQWNDEEKSILECAEENGITLPFGCRKGNCGSCVLAISSGSVCYDTPPRFEVGDGQCLACLAKPNGDIELEHS